VCSRFDIYEIRVLEGKLMFYDISSIRNQPPFLFTPSALRSLNLHFTSYRASEHLLQAIIEECNR